MEYKKEGCMRSGMVGGAGDTMMRTRSIGALLVVGGMMAFLASCSGSSHSDDVIAEGSIYDAGVSVSAVGYDEACDIRLFHVNEEGNLSLLSDGDYVEPGSAKFAVEAGAGASGIDRVFVADGALYQIEALPQDGRYVCEFMVSGEDLYQVVLIQVIHPGGRASKEKIVLRTAPSVPGGTYVKNGVGILASQEMLDLQKEDLAALLDEKIQELFDSIRQDSPSLVTELKFGDSDPSTVDVAVHSIEAVHSDAMPRAVLRARFTIRDVTLAALPLYSQSFLSTSSNDLLVDTYLAVDDTGSEGDVHLVFDLMDSVRATFSQPFFLQSTLERLIATELGRIELPPISFDLAGGGYDPADFLPGQVQIFGSDVNVQEIVNGLDPVFDTYIFADIYGIPETTTHEIIALGLGLCSQDSEGISWNSPDEGSPPASIDMEDVFNDLFEAAIDGIFEDIRQEYQGVVTTLTYGDGNPATDDFIVGSLVLGSTGDTDVKTARVQFTVKQVDLEAASLFGIPLICTQDNDLAIDAVFFIEHRDDDAGGWIILSSDSQTDPTVSFKDWFAGRELVEGMVRQDLKEMAVRSYDIDELLAGFEIGLDPSGSSFTSEPYAIFPDVFPGYQDPGWILTLPDTFTLSLAVSQSVINQLLAGIAAPQTEWDVYELLMKLLGEDFPGFKKERSAAEQTVMRLSVPPAVDIRDSRIRIVMPDIVFQYRISDKPQWEASVDVCLIIAPSARGHRLDIDLSRVPGKNNFHVMRDNPGNLGIFDHSSLADDVLGSLPRLLGGSPGAAFLSLGLDSWEPSLIFEDRDEPMAISAGGSYLYIDMAASGIDILQ